MPAEVSAEQADGAEARIRVGGASLGPWGLGQALTAEEGRRKEGAVKNGCWCTDRCLWGLGFLARAPNEGRVFRRLWAS